jgi:hypothetical protein
LFGGGGAEVAPDEVAVFEEESLAGGELAQFERDAEGLDDSGVFVGEEGEREVELVFESFLGFDGIGADADDFDAFFGKFFVGIAKGAGLLGATGGVGLGVEVNEGVAFGGDFLDVDVFAFFRLLGDVRSGGTFGNFVGFGGEAKSNHGEEGREEDGVFHGNETRVFVHDT